MKRLITFLLALMLAWIGANAQTVVHECVAVEADWSATNSVSLALNTWSIEGNTDGSGMTTPFMQYHNGTNAMANTVISHTQLTGLSSGYYTVSVLGRLYTELNNGFAEGITFNAGSASVDMYTNGIAGTSCYYNTYTLLTQVEGSTLDINFNVTNATNNWLAWKDLVVTYLGEDPKLSYVTGDMNSTVEQAMKAAVDAWNESLTDNSLFEAAEEAIAAAEESVAQYAEIAAVVEKLDETGATLWASSTSGQAYTAKSLATSDDYSTDLATAVLAQTTENSDMSYVLSATGTWGTASGGSLENPLTDKDVEASYNGSGWSVGKVLWKTVEGLPAGKYSVSFYAAANYANTGNSGTFLANGATAYANSATKNIDINYKSSASYTNGTLEESELVTLTFSIYEESGSLEFGIEALTSGSTGNWYLAKAASLTLLSLGADVEAGDEVHSCVAELSHWTQTYTGEGTSGTYAYNDWSVEADASGMVTPFLQTWVYNAILSDQTIDHNQLTGMTPGWYSVTIDARIMNETGEAITGTATLTANDDFIYLISDGSDGSYNGEAEEYGTYTVQCYVGDEGTLDIGFTIANANFNWLAWKNLSVVYLGETVEYNVGEATASETVVSPGQTVTLTFADCTKGDEEATLGVSSSANVTFGETSVTLTTKGTITFTFDVPNVTESGEYTLTLPASTIVWTYNGETKAGNAAQTITFSVLVPATIDAGEYLIVDAEGNYLGGGLAYGTEAAIIGKPQFIGFEAQENGTYHLDSHQYNSETAHYLGSNLYFDSSAIDWTLVEVEDGYAIYGTADTGTGYLTSNGFQTVATIGETPYAWTLVTMDDIVASMADATEDAPVDVTALIASPEMKRNSNTTYYPTWTVSTGSVTFGQNSTIGGTATANCAESWHSDGGFDVNQTITLPLAGTYKLSAQGFHTGEETIVLYAGEDTADLPIPTTDPADQAAAYQAFLEGTYPVDAITITTYSSDETVTIGFKGDNSSEWVVMGELDLQYLGVVEETVTWTMTDANWGTLILPFAVTTVPDGLTIYTCTGTTTSTDTDGNETTTVTATVVEGGIAANTPYLVKGDVEKDTEYEFTGTPVEAENGLTSGLLTGTYKTLYYDDLIEAAGSNMVYLLQNHEAENDEEGEGVAFYPVVTTGESGEATLTANHCYLTLSGSNGVRAYIGFPDSGEETGIVAVEGDVIPNDAIYDLSGRRVSKAVKGVYIQNGKKVLVK